MTFTKIQFITLFQYHWETNTRLLKCAAVLEEIRYNHHPGFGRGSIHDLLVHLLRADQSWRVGLETGIQGQPPSSEDYSTLEAVSDGYENERIAWTKLLEGFSEGELHGDIELRTLRDDQYTFPRWRILQHLILHVMQHHSELAQLLTNEGQSPGDIDFIFYRG